MTDTLNWIYTKDHRPTFEECKGKVMVYHCKNWDRTATNSNWIEDKVDFNISVGIDAVDRYCIITITNPDPEPVPCKVCGGKVEYVHDPAYDGDKNPYVVECTRGGHVISFTAPTRAEAIATWNKWNGG